MSTKSLRVLDLRSFSRGAVKGIITLRRSCTSSTTGFATYKGKKKARRETMNTSGYVCNNGAPQTSVDASTHSSSPEHQALRILVLGCSRWEDLMGPLLLSLAALVRHVSRERWAFNNRRGSRNFGRAIATED
jgi:hypothetical protein